MRTLPAACCLLAALALDAGAARAQFRLMPPGPEDDYRPQPWRHGRPVGVADLLLNAVLQVELKLSDEQVDRLEDVDAEMRQRHRAEAKRLERLREEAREASLALHETTEREGRRVTQNLLTPAQWDRLRQIEVQRAGPAAFVDPAVQHALKLTADQLDAVAEALTEGQKNYREELSRAREAKAGGAEEEKRLRQVTQQLLRKREAQLTPEQKKRWTALVGEPCPRAAPKGRPLFLRLVGSGRAATILPLTLSAITEELPGELKLSEEQRDRLRALPRVLKEGHKEEWARLRKQEQERERAAVERRQGEELATALTAVLRPEQRHRLEQLRVQALGPAAWDDPAVQRVLRLTAEQKAALRKARDEARADVGDLCAKALQEAERAAGGDFRRKQRLLERQAAAGYRVLMERQAALLTPDQRQRWRELTGPAVRFRVDFAQ